MHTELTITRIQRLDIITMQMRSHAGSCRKCAYPIIDEEGNPGYLAEACPRGAALVNRYLAIEHALLRGTGPGSIINAYLE
jgi:hypothetical protein